MRDQDFAKLEHKIEEITAIIGNFGLDPFPMRYEVCPSDILYSIGAYSMPSRFSHWSFGKAFERMKRQYDFNLSKIYELVINSNPCYAFLLSNNSLPENELIAAHVLGHSDFFKNNLHFADTQRDMVESMAVTSKRFRKYEFAYGRKEVELILDAGLAIQEHIDPHFRISHHHNDGDCQSSSNKDVIGFIAVNAPNLQDWQRDILLELRKEMHYFWPQMETKIMNEGWASYWHIRVMRELDLNEKELLQFARMNAFVTAPNRFGINPYHLGLRMFEGLEKMYGRSFIFEVRERDNDISFIRNYLTREMVREMDLYVFNKEEDVWKITSKDWQITKQTLIHSKINGGFPYLTVKDDDYHGNRELYLVHKYEGVELDPRYLERTIPYVHQLWGKPVHLETVMDGKTVLFSYDKELNRKDLSA
ncbi:MAG TPA: SpoVR family protein [Bacillales bacterium]|nr:SpoVR family protein [Bacillales bacterium]